MPIQSPSGSSEMSVSIGTPASMRDTADVLGFELPHVDSDLLYLPHCHFACPVAVADAGGAAVCRSTICEESGCCGGGVSLDEPPHATHSAIGSEQSPPHHGVNRRVFEWAIFVAVTSGSDIEPGILPAARGHATKGNTEPMPDARQSR